MAPIQVWRFHDAPPTYEEDDSGGYQGSTEHVTGHGSRW